MRQNSRMKALQYLNVRERKKQREEGGKGMGGKKNKAL